jgi:hypothetical protein
MKLIDPVSGKMECSVCGQVHWAQIKTGGNFKRGVYQCENECNTPEYEVFNAIVIERKDYN